MEEKCSKIPHTEIVLNYFGHHFTREQFENCEINIFQILNYNLGFKTPLHYLLMLLEAQIVSESELLQLKALSRTSIELLSEERVLLLLDQTLFNYHLYKYTSLAVASSLGAVLRNLLGLEAWPNRLQTLAGISQSELEPCSILMR